MPNFCSLFSFFVSLVIVVQYTITIEVSYEICSCLMKRKGIPLKKGKVMCKNELSDDSLSSDYYKKNSKSHVWRLLKNNSDGLLTWFPIYKIHIVYGFLIIFKRETSKKRKYWKIYYLKMIEAFMTRHQPGAIKVAAPYNPYIHHLWLWIINYKVATVVNIFCWSIQKLLPSFFIQNRKKYIL